MEITKVFQSSARNITVAEAVAKYEKFDQFWNDCFKDQKEYSALTEYVSTTSRKTGRELLEILFKEHFEYANTKFNNLASKVDTKNLLDILSKKNHLTQEEKVVLEYLVNRLREIPKNVSLEI